MKNLPNGTLAVRPTVLSTFADLNDILNLTDATPAEKHAVSSRLAGEKTYLAAAKDNGLIREGDTDAITVNRFRTRCASICVDMLEIIAAPAIAHFKALNAKTSEAEAEKAIADKIAAWEASGRIGRQPGQGNRPVHEVALDHVLRDSRTAAREAVGIARQGRIKPEMQEKFAAKFTTIYTKGLIALSKKHDLGYDEGKIDRMVNRAIKELKVEPAVQKAVKIPKKNKVEVPATETVSDVVPEPVV